MLKIKIVEGGWNEMYVYFKAYIDVIVSCIFLVLLFPLLFIIGVSIKLDSKGPAIIKQKRVGQNGVIFNMFKFRTMKLNTPSLPTSALEDPNAYITRVGRFLRKSSLDELPQLLNIVRGEMSFIGPRPVLVNEKNLIKLRKKARIEKVKPGLTGLAQIHGRDFLSDSKKVVYDKLYVLNMCLTLDIKIIFKTFAYVINARGIRA